MQIPDEFYDFCLYLHQDSEHVYGPEPQDWIKGALRHIDRKCHPALRAYVDELLNGNYTGKELQDIWHSTDAEMGAGVTASA